MSFSLHRFSLVGNLTRDPEIAISKQGKTIGKISVCVNETYKTKDQGYKNKPYYFIVTIFDEYIMKRLGKHQKGDLVFTEGNIVCGNYVNAMGNKVYVTNLIAQTLVGPGLKGRELKQLESVYQEDKIKERTKPPATGKDAEVTADEIEDIFLSIDV